ncbi:AAC(3) family N-acetyltransferase [Campylobacter insulaenigrae]|uniref:AAC(3) family N-acetyltransferase n=1 Tax=Campylobacter insulaenigrae TaxID=260714 RepID=UPI0021533EEB|nr:AAC(3) family N-acetyltransferase [Campylobacter insulaenigrae]MCR6572453.1 AAC(3) family N-acetyltransferase [Campylobacter insulaenigrae]MCR6577154.1 AAC(3) family N-acetyltransferase [Campylobacter insulaenigrae]MCR6583308.1 AAC(3) family N-acetyltransferase [Campylobacter insulaenigrae]
MKYFLEHNNKKYTKDDLIKTLCEVGIKKGDIICVHTELFNFGTPLLPKNEFLQTILEAFFEAIGKEGTLIMPTFTYSFCKNQIYDKLNSITKVGALNEYFRKQEKVVRTNDPIFSFAVKGAKQDLFLKDTTSCFGKDCVYDILIKENTKFMLFGSTTGHTLTHHIEEKYKVEYRYFKNFNGITIDENGNQYEKNINFYVRYLDKNSLPNVDMINEVTRKTKQFQEKEFGGACICVFNTREYEMAIKNALEKDENALVIKD